MPYQPSLPISTALEYTPTRRCSAPPDTITLDQLMTVAVGFFYPDMIVDGQIYTYVCTEFNAMRELPSRNLALEAPAFAAIMGQLRLGEDSRINADVSSAIRLMGRLDAPVPTKSA